MRALAILSLAAFVLTLSGCSGEPADTGGEGAVAPSGGGADLDARAEAMDSEERPAEGRLVTAEGTTPVGGCVGTAVAGQCQYALGDGNLLELAEGATRVIGILTWDARSPASETMGVLVMVPTPSGGWTVDNSIEAPAGPSPLTLDLDLTGVGKAALWFTSYTGQNVGVAYAGAQTPQEFAFAGLEFQAA